MTQLAAEQIMNEFPSIKVVIIAIKINDSKFNKLLQHSSKQYISNKFNETGKTPDYLMSFNFSKGGESAFNVQLLNFHSEINANNILRTNIKTYLSLFEPGSHLNTVDKSYNLSITSIARIKLNNNINKFIFIYKASFLSLFFERTQNYSITHSHANDQHKNQNIIIEIQEEQEELFEEELENEVVEQSEEIEVEEELEEKQEPIKTNQLNQDPPQINAYQQYAQPYQYMQQPQLQQLQQQQFVQFPGIFQYNGCYYQNTPYGCFLVGFSQTQ
ncbi:Hypothetical_protein [Hexamita inflata]|uniref:Hypothetical_protein n=1 Tax=Hexamita inflata TaxID=28002 RepID=A0ABP1H6B7_9EUKA